MGNCIFKRRSLASHQADESKQTLYFSTTIPDRTPQIRGAPAIASLASLGLACDLLKDEASDSQQSVTADQVTIRVDQLCSRLITSRPTAVNLAEALGRLKAASRLGTTHGGSGVRQNVIRVAQKIWTEDIQRCHLIGDNGARWLLETLEASGSIAHGDKVNVLTVSFVTKNWPWC